MSLEAGANMPIPEITTKTTLTRRVRDETIRRAFVPVLFPVLARIVVWQ